ncbi:MAG: BON domain-containing protein, partial [Acidobacteria bacterium]|nr:BON domain-containing protein [Acidobacteriota bacterium]
MGGEGVYCSSCGITLRAFMKVCPRCGALRNDATLLEVDQPRETIETNNKVISLTSSTESTRKNRDQNLVFLPPFETGRRFPVFTAGQWLLIAAGIGLLVLMSVIAFLLWRQQKREWQNLGTRPVVTTQGSPTFSPSPNTSPAPSPTPPLIDDQAITAAVKSTLLAYNPLGFSRYRFHVKDGEVTLEGDAAHQPEKDGAENVIKLIAGVKSVVNKMIVKEVETLAPVRLNMAEANLLDEAMRRQILEEENAKNNNRQQIEAERLRREKAAARQREEEVAVRKTVEEKLQREAEENEKRQEEVRRSEAERRARAEEARIVASVLRSGTVAWRGIVDGIDEIIITGGSASVRHLSGTAPREVHVSFSAPIPRSPVN